MTTLDALTVSFGALHRSPVHRRLRVESPAEVFGPLPAELGPLEIDLQVRGSPRDGVRVTGRLTSTAACQCRRCLRAIRVSVSASIDTWFRADRDVTPGEDGVWPYAANAGEIDLTHALREDLLLAIPGYPVCQDACAGLCPSCGARLGEEDCSCPPPDPDPRWAALTGREASREILETPADPDGT